MKKIFLNKYNILFILFLLASISILAIFSRAKIKKVEYVDDLAIKKGVELAQMEEDYKKEIKEIMDDFETLIDDIGLYSTSTDIFVDEDGTYLMKVNEIKRKIVNLKAPSSESKDLHLNLVIALSEIANYLETHLYDSRIKSLELVEKVKNSFELLDIS